MKAKRALVLVAIALGAAGILAPRRLLHRLIPSPQPQNLLLISIDTLRADHLGCYGYAEAQTPRLDALAKTGLRFAQATTVVPLTLPAHSSLMTGTFPAWNGVRDNGSFYLSEDQITLATVLSTKGFRTGGFVGAFVLDRRWGIAQGFSRYFDDFDLQRFEQATSMDFIRRPGSDVVDHAIEWLEEDTRRPFFAWVHLYDPHAPYDPQEPFRSRFPATAIGAYDAAISSSDAQVGRLLDALEKNNRRGNTLIIVVGDHGEMLGEHGEQTHGFFVYDAAVHIPLILSGPQVPTGVIPEQVRIVDVMPTALQLLGQPIPGPVQGVSLLPLARGEHLALLGHSESWYPRYHFGWSELVSVQDGRHKYIEAPRPELYDLAQDPREERNLANQQAQERNTLTRMLQEFDRRTARAAAAQAPQPMDLETQERLSALGYFGGRVGSGGHEARLRGDPKDKVELYNLLKRAAEESSEGKNEDAIAKVKEALARDPEMVEGYMVLGNLYRKEKRPTEAVAAYREALTRDPDNQNSLFSLAVTLKDMGRLAEASKSLERAQTLDPRNGNVLLQLAEVRTGQLDFSGAEAVLRQALALKVDEPRCLLQLGVTLIEEKRYQEAEGVLRRALDLKPDLETARFNLGLVDEGKGEIERAIGEYQTELRIHDRAFRACFNLAKLLEKEGRHEEALARFRRTVELQPTFGTGYLFLAKALLDSGDLVGAEHSARTGLASHPDAEMAPLGHYVLSDLYAREGRSADSQRELAAAQRMERSR
jgi:arylsulfatase A-like enzyme/cytochrome c-type biogenesis protein CcmH/NrfG